MPKVPLVIHERLGNWARQLRPRVAGWPVQVVETRSAAELSEGLRRSVCPLAVVDLDRWPARMLSDLEHAGRGALDPLVLVLDPARTPGAEALGRELGATLVWPGFVPPPRVEALLARWLEVARGRRESAGWMENSQSESEPWDVAVDRI